MDFDKVIKYTLPFAAAFVALSLVGIAYGNYGIWILMVVGVCLGAIWVIFIENIYKNSLLPSTKDFLFLFLPTLGGVAAISLTVSNFFVASEAIESAKIYGEPLDVGSKYVLGNMEIDLMFFLSSLILYLLLLWLGRPTIERLNKASTKAN